MERWHGVIGHSEKFEMKEDANLILTENIYVIGLSSETQFPS